MTQTPITGTFSFVTNQKLQKSHDWRGSLKKQCNVVSGLKKPKSNAKNANAKNGQVCCHDGAAKLPSLKVCVTQYQYLEYEPYHLLTSRNVQWNMSCVIYWLLKMHSGILAIPFTESYRNAEWDKSHVIYWILLMEMQNGIRAVSFIEWDL